MATFGDTQLNVLKNKAVADYVTPQLIQASVLRSTILDLSRLAGPGVGSISIPSGGNMVIGKMPTTEDTTCAVPQGFTYADQVMQIDQHAFAAWSIKDKAGYQADFNVELDLAGRAARAMGLKIDEEIYDILDAMATVVTPASGTDALGTLLALATAARKANVPLTGDVFATLDPGSLAQVITSNSGLLIDASRYGSTTPIATGEVGNLFGLRLVPTNVADQNEIIVYHREAAAIAFNWDGRLQSEYDLKCLETVYNYDTLYGLKGINPALVFKAAATTP